MYPRSWSITPSDAKLSTTGIFASLVSSYLRTADDLLFIIPSIRAEFLSRQKWKARTVAGRRGKSLLRDPGSELRLVMGRREKKKGEDNKWDGKKKNKKKLLHGTPGARSCQITSLHLLVVVGLVCMMHVIPCGHLLTWC